MAHTAAASPSTSVARRARPRGTRSQADGRLVTNIIGEELTFSDDERREIENLVINRKDGEVTHLVIASDDDSLFNDDPRAVPMDRVEISERGELRASIDLRKIEGMQRYAPEFLR